MFAKVNQILLAGLIVLFIFGMSFMAVAEPMTEREYFERNVLCTVLAAEANYFEEAERSAERVIPYITNEGVQEYIYTVIDLVSQFVHNQDTDPVETAEALWSDYCQEA